MRYIHIKITDTTTNKELTFSQSVKELLKYFGHKIRHPFK